MIVSGETFTLSVTKRPDTKCKWKRKKRRVRKKWDKMYNEIIYQGIGWISDLRVESGRTLAATVTLEAKC